MQQEEEQERLEKEKNQMLQSSEEVEIQHANEKVEIENEQDPNQPIIIEDEPKGVRIGSSL